MRKMHFSVVVYSMVRFGMVWYGMVRYDMVRYGTVAATSHPVPSNMGVGPGHGGVVGYGEVHCDVEWFTEELSCTVQYCMIRYGTVLYGTALYGMV